MLIRQLEEQLHITHEQLQATTEQLESSNEGFLSASEELMSINEEFQSANEELQSTNEELETSKEELQALNEELVTVNAELQGKVEELNQATGNMENLLASSEIATIFLDRRLNLKGFTPAAAAVFNLIPTDTGRPFRHFAGRIDWPGFSSDAETVLAGEPFAEREVTTLDSERCYLKRIFPYRTPEGMIDGIVVTLIDITERKLAEAEVQRARDEWELTFNSVPDLIAIIDHQHRLVRVNRAMAEQLGRTPEECVGIHCHEAIHGSNLPPGFCPHSRTLTDGGEHCEEVYEEGLGGDYLVTTSPLLDPEGRMIGTVHVARNITEQKNAEIEKETTVEFLRLVNESTTTQDLIKSAANFFQKKSGCEALGIRLRRGDDYPYYEVRGFSQEFVHLENELCSRDAAGDIIRDSVGNPIIDCMCGNVICSRFDSSKPFFTHNGSFWSNSTTELLVSTSEADRHARTRNRCNGEGYESVALVPLNFGNERLGLLQLNDRRTGMFTPQCIALWERLAGYLAAALAKFQAEDALRQSEEQYRTLLDTLFEGFCIVEVLFDADERPMDYRFLEINAAFEAQTGLKDAQGKRMRELAPDHEAHWFEIYGKVALTGESARFVNEAKALDRWYDVSAYRLGGPDSRKVAILFNDISDIKRAEEALRESEEQFRTLADAIPQLCWTANADGWITWYNQRWYEYTGTTPEQMEGWGWQSVHDPQVLPDVVERWQASIATGKPFDMVFPLLGADGVFRPFLTRVMPVCDQDGKVVRWFGTNTDISEQRNTEEALRQSEEQYRTLLDTLFEGFCIIEMLFDADNHPIDYRFLEINAAFEAQTGLQNAQGKLMRELAPDIEQHWFEIYGKVALTGESVCFVNESKVLNRWYDVSAYRVDGPDSRKVAVLFSDITEIKRAEENARQLHEAVALEKDRLSALVNSISDEIWFASTEGEFTLVNPAGSHEFSLESSRVTSTGKDCSNCIPEFVTIPFHIFGEVRPMKVFRRLMACLCLFATAAAIAATPDWEALGKRWWAHVQYLADDKWEGRDTGSGGFEMAAAYVVAQFKNAGLKPAGADGFLQPVRFQVAETDESQSSIKLTLETKIQQLELGEDAFFVPHADGNAMISAPTVFAGYGLTVPELNYDDFAGLDAKGKYVVYISGGPASMPAAVKAHYQSRDERLKWLKKSGAIGMAIIPNPKAAEVPWSRTAGSRLAAKDGAERPWRCGGAEPAHHDGVQSGACGKPVRGKRAFVSGSLGCAECRQAVAAISAVGEDSGSRYGEDFGGKVGKHRGGAAGQRSGVEKGVRGHQRAPGSPGDR